MLLALRLKNLAIIDSLELNLAPGLNVISGETGAGKSVIVGALGLLLGGRASGDLVRSGEEEGEIEALFDASGHDLPEGLDLGDASEVLVRRTVSLKARSRTWLNMRLCPSQVAATLCATLTSICGQHEHQSLLRDKNSLHLDILDRYGGLLREREQVAAAYLAASQARRTLEAARTEAKQLAERAELLRFQAAEIAAANLTAGEEEALEAERKVLRAAERLVAGAGEAYQLLDGDEGREDGEGAAVSRLGVAGRKIEELARLDARLEAVRQALEPALIQAQEAAGLLRDYLEGVRPDPERLEAVEERLAAIQGLKRKYGATIEEVVAFGERAARDVAALEQADERLSGLGAELARLREECWRLSKDLSGARAEAAARLSAALTNELRQVGMNSAEFSVRLEPIGEAGPNDAAGDGLSHEGERLSRRGLEEAAFLVAPNVGEGFKPLARIASGGELSRVVLGIKTVLSGGGETLVFDEVDAGLGGAVAEVVGRKLKGLAEGQQVICITHLPQIACFAERHFAVAKEVAGGRTLARVRQLSEAERLEEVARMLGGVRITEKTRQHAKEMVKGAGAGPTT
jgi:DNA repair protein RecN (Recombination protein N)